MLDTGAYNQRENYRRDTSMYNRQDDYRRDQRTYNLQDNYKRDTELLPSARSFPVYSSCYPKRGQWSGGNNNTRTEQWNRLELRVTPDNVKQRETKTATPAVIAKRRVTILTSVKGANMIIRSEIRETSRARREKETNLRRKYLRTRLVQ